MFMIPSTIRNAAETEDPMMPPTRENASNLVDTAAAVPATTSDVIMTILYAWSARWCDA